MRAGGSWPGAPFFSLDERTAAAALLLLLSSNPTTTTTTTSSSTSASSSFAIAVSTSSDEEEPSLSSSSSSCVSDSSAALASVAGAQADPLRLLAWTVRRLRLKRKAVRKTRPVVLSGSTSTKNMNKDWWAPQQEPENQHPEEDPLFSCVSSTSTAAALGDSIPLASSGFPMPPSPLWWPQVAPPSCGYDGVCFPKPSPPSSPPNAATAGASCSHGGGGRVVMRMRRVEGKNAVMGSGSDGGGVCGSSGVRRRAKAILEFLRARGGTSEVRIRAAVGDSPDTSKALRMLLKLDQVKRSGTGGRQDPFLYWVSGPGGGRTPRPPPQLGAGAPVPPCDSY